MGKLNRQGLQEFPMRFTARGLVDAFDSTDKFPGACLALSNLLFDQSNPEIMVSRPGVAQLASFFGYTSTAGVVSVQTTIAGVTYGMIGTQKYPLNKDEPFAFDHASGTFLSLGSVVGSFLPTTQSLTGAWTPPTIANVGVFMIVTHPGFDGVTRMFGWFDLTNPAAPVWRAGDTSTNGLPSKPVAVANFNNRAYFACKNTTPFTDVLTLGRASASQILTLGDISDITALSGLPIQTTSSGVVQSLLAFKAFQIWQITGDLAPMTLAQNFISLTTGCVAPRSIAQSPLGTYFAASQGPMIIDQFGILKTLTHSAQENESDVQAGWQAATVPSRMAGGYSGSIYRLSMQTVIRGMSQVNDYWFDENKRRWNGPHTFPYDCVSQRENYFVIVSNTKPGRLLKSEAMPSMSSVYNDLGSAITTTLQSSTFPKTGHMSMKQVVESTQELASGGSVAAYAITALDDLGNTLNSVNVFISPGAGALWGTGMWGSFSWASPTNIPTTYNIPWTAPLVFKKMAIQLQAQASASVSQGTFMARYRDVGYPNVR